MEPNTKDKGYYRELEEKIKKELVFRLGLKGVDITGMNLDLYSGYINLSLKVPDKN